eukprot:8564807-Alexandrium_andersonii.AAC.1
MGPETPPQQPRRVADAAPGTHGLAPLRGAATTLTAGAGGEYAQRGAPRPPGQQGGEVPRPPPPPPS